MFEDQGSSGEPAADAPLAPSGEVVRASIPEVVTVVVGTVLAAKPFVEMAIKRDTEITVARTRAEADVAIAHIQADAAVRVAEINADAARASTNGDTPNTGA